MPISRDAHLTMNRLVDYRNRLDTRSAAPLQSALSRLMKVFQSRLFLALLDIEDFYESILLDPEKNMEEKTSAALEVAVRWENISSPSLVTSTIDLRRTHLSKELDPLERARSLYHLDRTDLVPYAERHYSTTVDQIHEYKRPSPSSNHSASTLSYSMQNYTPSSQSYHPTARPISTPEGSPGRVRCYNSMTNHSSDGAYSSSFPKHPVAKPRRRRLKRPTSAVVPPNPTKEALTCTNSMMNGSFIADHQQMIPRNIESVNRILTPLSKQNSEHHVRNREVIIKKSAHGFGFSIAGGYDHPNSDIRKDTCIHVTRITPGSAADKPDGLKIGDKILSVNGVSLLGCSHDEAVKLMQLAGPVLNLIVFCTENLRINAHPNTTTNAIDSTAKSLNPPLSARTHQTNSTIGSAESTGSANSLGLTNTSLCSGSLFGSTFSRQTLSSLGPQSINKIVESSVMPKSTNCPKDECRPVNPHKLLHQRSANLEKPVSNMNASTAVNNTPSSLPIYRRSRRTMVPTRFPALSWCAGSHKPSAYNSTDNVEDKSEKITHNERSISSGGRLRTTVPPRPVPAPQPGPLVIEVTLERGTRSGLGFSIAGGVDNETENQDSGIFITKITPGGVADTDGRIEVGDRIVQVNDTSVVGVTHEQAVRTLKRAGDQVCLLLIKVPPTSAKPEEVEKTSDFFDTEMQYRQSPIRSVQTPTLPKVEQLHFISSSSIPVHPPDVSKDSRDQLYDFYPRNSKGSDLDTRFESTGQGILEAQMGGIIEYAAATSVAGLLNKWPSARLVTLYRTARLPGMSIGEIAHGKTVQSHSSGVGNLGLNIVGGDGSVGTFVSNVQSNKPAGRSKRIFVGDRLLAVNGLDVSEHGHEQAALALRNAFDRVDLLLVYSPEEYAAFEKLYHRQMKAVGHKIRSKSSKQHRSDKSSADTKDKHHKQSLDSQRTFSSPPDVSLRVDSEPTSTANTMVNSTNPLHLRCLIEYDPTKESHQTPPKRAFCLRSGDLVCVLNWADPEWWEAQRLDPASDEPIGPVGLIPSRTRLERRGRTRSRHVNFLARSSAKFIASSFQSGVERPTTHHRDNAAGLSVSVTSLASNRADEVDQFTLSYVAVTSIRLSLARPVVILGHMKDQIADELLSEFPNHFGTVVPFTTRACRSDEVEGRDYHFVISRETMVADIAAQRYLEAGEYNGNLYGTHMDSVFEISESGLHCLLDVGGPALRRLEHSGLPPIALLLFPDAFPNPVSKMEAHLPPLSAQDKFSTSPASHSTGSNSQSKLARLIRHFSNHLTGIIATDSFNEAYARVKELIFENAGPVVWLNSPHPIP